MNLIEALKKYGKVRRRGWIKGVYWELNGYPNDFLTSHYEDSSSKVWLAINDFLAEDWCEA